MDAIGPGLLRTVGTVFLFAAFIALCVWAYSPRQRSRFDEAAQLPLGDDDPRVESEGENR